MANKKKSIIVITSLLALLKSILSVVFAFMLKDFLGYFNTGTNTEIEMQIVNAILFLFCYLGVELTYNYFESKYITENMYDLKSKAMKSILGLSINDYNNRHSGEYISLLTNDAKAIEDDYYGSVFSFATMLLSLIVSIIALIYLNTILGIVSVLISLITLILPAVVSNKINVYRNKFSKQQDYLTRKIKGILDGFETIKEYDVENLVENDFNKNIIDVEHDNKILKFLLQSSSTIGRLMGYIIFFVIIITGLYLSTQNKITFGVLLASIQLSNNLISPIVSGIQMLTKIHSVKNIRQKFNKITNEKNKNYEVKAIEFNDNIMLNNVTFTYSENSFSINDISLKIEKGKKYAIIGESGSGKSTLGKVLMGVYQKQTGDIMIDGISIDEYQPESIIKLFSSINQNTFMLDDTIENNVSFYKSISIDLINKALTEAQLSQFIESHDKIGENGVLLSGGEKQRLSLARAIAHNSQIILMDEATSQLDNENMLKIENMILNSTKTIITITHRLIKEVLQKYDCIFIIANGKIVETGTFNHLMESKGHLYSLFNVFGS